MTSHADPLKVKTEQGKVQGKTINNGKVNAFLGLPYAAPPVGDLRWKAPEPPAKWKGTRDATKFGAHCAQGRVFDDMIFQDSGPSEDCLFLNVYVARRYDTTRASCRSCSGFMAAATLAAAVRSRVTMAIFCP